MRRISKCCKAAVYSSYSFADPSAGIQDHCSKCTKACEAEFEKANHSLSKNPNGNYDIVEREGASVHMSADEIWVRRQCEAGEQSKIEFGLKCLAEGRKREREEAIREIINRGAVELTKEIEPIVQQREEAAAREMAEMVVKDCQYRSLDMSVEWLMQEFKKWKQRKGQGGVGL